MADPDTTTEKKGANIAAGEQPVTVTPEQLSSSPEQKKLLKDLESVEAQQLSKLEEAFKERTSKAALSETALSALKELHNRQKVAIQALYKEYNGKINSAKTGEQKSAQALFEEVKMTTEKRINFIQYMFNVVGKNNKFSEEDIFYLQRMIGGVEEMLKASPEIQRVYQRLVDKNDLNSDDFAIVISIFNPNEIPVDIKALDPQKTLEATSAGLLITLMRSDQRMNFVREFMKSGRKSETAEVIDKLILSGILPMVQGEKLFEEAINSGIIDKETFHTKYESRFTSGFYVEKINELEKTISDAIGELKKQYAENPLNRFFGAPMVGFAGVLYSALWLLSNLMAGNGLKSPFTWASLGSGAVFYEMMTGSSRKGAPWHGMGHGSISKGIEWALRKSGDRSAENDEQKIIFTNFSRFYSNMPASLREYCNGGGIKTVLDLKRKKINNHQPLAITPEELLAEEQSEKLKSCLSELHKNFPQKSIEYVNTIAEFCSVLNIDRQSVFDQKIKIIMEALGIEREIKPIG